MLPFLGNGFIDELHSVTRAAAPGEVVITRCGDRGSIALAQWLAIVGLDRPTPGKDLLASLVSLAGVERSVRGEHVFRDIFEVAIFVAAFGVGGDPIAAAGGHGTDVAHHFGDHGAGGAPQFDRDLARAGAGHVARGDLLGGPFGGQPGGVGSMEGIKTPGPTAGEREARRCGAGHRVGELVVAAQLAREG